MSDAHPVVLKTNGFTISWDGISYVVRKPGDKTGRELSYCTTLETALDILFRQMVISRIRDAEGYGASMEELKAIILEVRRDFEELVVMPEHIRRMAQRIAARAKMDPSAYKHSGEDAFRRSLRRETGGKAS